MRYGPGVEKEFKGLEEWGTAESIRVVAFPRDENASEGSEIRSNALSGGERNRLFLRSKDNFKDVSLISGVDFREDGRGFALFDYNRDGWLDLGITSPNAPRFRIAKNRFADFQDVKNSFVEISLVGGQTSASPSTEWSSRDAFGSRIRVTMGDDVRMFQLSCGEGLSIQNSNRIHIGLGQSKEIEKLEVLWPSGKTTVKENVAAGERLTVYENSSVTK